jgi:hypothetical protein
MFIIVGWTTIASVGFLFILLPFQWFILFMFVIAFRKIVKYSDERIKSINEILQNMKFIKYFAWEEQYTELIHKKRSNEVWAIFQLSSLRTALFASAISTPTLVNFL